MQVVVSIVALIVMIAGGYAMLAQGGGPQAAVIVILTGLIGYLVYRSQKAIDRTQALENALIEEKRRLYRDFIDLWRSISGNGGPLKSGGGGHGARKVNDGLDDRQTSKLGDFIYGSILVGSDEVVRAVSVISRLDQLGDDRVRVPALADVLLALRKDLGYPDTKLTPAELSALFVNDVETHLDWFALWPPVRDRWRAVLAGKGRTTATAPPRLDDRADGGAVDVGPDP